MQGDAVCAKEIDPKTKSNIAIIAIIAIIASLASLVLRFMYRLFSKIFVVVPSR